MRSRHGLCIAMSALAVVFCLSVGAACAQTAKTTINAVTTTLYPPFEFRDPKTNKLTGFDIDLLEAVGAKMGAKINWIESSFNQLLTSIETKRADVVTDLTDTPERRESVSLVDYLIDRSVFLTLRDNTARFPGTDALCGKRVAAARGTTWPGEVAKWSDEHCTKIGKPGVIVVEVANSPDARLQLNQGRVDASVQGAGTLAYQNTLENNRYATIAKFYPATVGFGFSKDDPQFGLELKGAVAAVMADGTYQRLLNNWNLPDDDALGQPMINGQP